MSFLAPSVTLTQVALHSPHCDFTLDSGAKLSVVPVSSINDPSLISCVAPGFVPFGSNDLAVEVSLGVGSRSLNVSSAWGSQRACVGVQVANPRVVIGQPLVLALFGPTLPVALNSA